MDELISSIYSISSKSDVNSVKTLENLLDEHKAICHINKHDKIPNHDGHIELITLIGVPIGELKVQVKTLRKNYVNPSHPVEYKLLKYITDSLQIPMIFIAIDQKNKKAFWMHLTKELANSLLSERIRLKKKEKTISLKFDKAKELSTNKPYIEWEQIVKKNLKSISGYTRSKSVTINISPTQPYLEMFHEFVDILYSTLNFIPPHILKSIQPILGNKGSFTNIYYDFSLRTSDKRIYDLFDSLSLKNGKINSSSSQLTKGTKNKTKKLQYIINKLTSNLFYSVIHKNKKIQISHLNNNKNCNCLKCLLKKLEYETLKDKLYPCTTSENIVITAYTNYKLGNYTWAAEQFLIARDNAIKQGNKFQKFLIQYNLSKLRILLKTNYFDKVPENISTLLSKIDIDVEFRNYDDETFFPIADWIYRERFLHSARKKINSLKEKLIIQYSSSIQGARSSNSNYRLLINEMAQIELFLQNNFVVFDVFVEYSELVKEFAEGLYASHATVQKGNGKLLHFNDWVLDILIRYSKPDQLITLYNRYKLPKLSYKTSNSDKEETSIFILKLINGYKNAVHISRKHFQEENFPFIENQLRLIRNAIVIASQCSFSSQNVSKIALAIANYAEKFGSYSDMKYIEYFYSLKRDQISSTTFKKVLLAGIKNPKFHHQSFFENISNNIQRQKITIAFTKRQYDLIINLSQNKCTFCNEIHSPVYLTYFHRVIKNSDQKKQIQKKIEQSLTKKFNFELFGLAVTFEILNINSIFLDLAMKNIKNKTHDDELNYKLSFLLNICFKEDINLSDPKFISLRGISPYYDWLLDMDKFDYALFTPDWVNEYSTRFYFKRMNESSKLKSELEHFLASEKSYYAQETMNTYINIYIRKSWKDDE